MGEERPASSFSESDMATSWLHEAGKQKDSPAPKVFEFRPQQQTSLIGQMSCDHLRNNAPLRRGSGQRSIVVVVSMSSAGHGRAVPKLLAVTLLRSGIGKPYWQKRTLKALGLVKMHKTIIHKSTPSVTGMLSSVKELIHVRPVVFRNDVENSPNKGAFLLNNGEMFVAPSCHTVPHSTTECRL